MTKLMSKLIKDGNSTAVRLPKVALTMSGISGAVELIVRDGEIVIKRPVSVRSTWVNAIVADKPKADKELDDWEDLAGEGIE